MVASLGFFLRSVGLAVWTPQRNWLWWARAAGLRFDAHAEPAPPEPPRKRRDGKRMARRASRARHRSGGEAALAGARRRRRGAHALSSRGDRDRPAEEPACRAHPRRRFVGWHAVL